MSGKRNVSVCRGHELANALYIFLPHLSVFCHRAFLIWEINTWMGAVRKTVIPLDDWWSTHRLVCGYASAPRWIDYLISKIDIVDLFSPQCHGYAAMGRLGQCGNPKLLSATMTTNMSFCGYFVSIKLVEHVLQTVSDYQQWSSRLKILLCQC